MCIFHLGVLFDEQCASIGTAVDCIRYIPLGPTEW